MNIGSVIKEIRKKKKISQITLANECGITQAYLSLLENNKKDANISLLKTIAKKLEVPLSALVLIALKDDEDIPEKMRPFIEEKSSEVSTAIITLLMP